MTKECPLRRSKKSTGLHKVDLPIKYISHAIVYSVLLWCFLFVLLGESLTAIRWISYFIMWASIPLLFFGALSLYFGRRWLSFSMLTLACMVSYPHLQLSSGINAVSAEPAVLYKVMTYSKMGRNRDIVKVSHVISSEKPDILFIQEITKMDAEVLIQRLSKDYDKPLNYIHHNNNLTISPYSLLLNSEGRFYSPQLTIELPESSVSIWNIHLQKSISGTDVQYKAVNQLVKQLATVKGPKIVAGDFNATILNYPYRKTKQYLRNAFEDAGVGFGFTFPSPARRMGSVMPFIRIDQVFLSSELVVDNVYVGEDSGGSDHYPVIASVSFRKLNSELN